MFTVIVWDYKPTIAFFNLTRNVEELKKKNINYT